VRLHRADIIETLVNLILDRAPVTEVIHQLKPAPFADAKLERDTRDKKYSVSDRHLGQRRQQRRRSRCLIDDFELVEVGGRVLDGSADYAAARRPRDARCRATQ